MGRNIMHNPLTIPLQNMQPPLFLGRPLRKDTLYNRMSRQTALLLGLLQCLLHNTQSQVLASRGHHLKTINTGAEIAVVGLGEERQSPGIGFYIL